jgi:hypothetical protein
MYKILEVIKELEQLKENYGDVKVMICSGGGRINFANDIFILEHENKNGTETVVKIWS